MAVLRGSIASFLEPLCHLMNSSYRAGIFPEDLKVAVVIPLFKKDDEGDISNYRPISLLTSFSKVFEKVLANRLLKFLKKFRVLNSQQHGFIKNKSTETAIFELTSSIIKALERDEIPVGLFLDLSKAFDMVDHGRLLEKLECYGIRGNQLCLLRSYLKGRKQRVLIKIGGREFLSDEQMIEMGVPQGSILGPLLFIIYINDFPSAVTNFSVDPLMYADDTSMLTKSTTLGSLEEGIISVLGAVEGWCNENRLLLNTSKTDCLIFAAGRSCATPPEFFAYGSHVISVSPSIKFLGMQVDGRLKWCEHVDNLIARLNSVIFTLNILRDRVSPSVLSVVYFSNFQSLIAYGIIFWGASSRADRVFITQKLAMRVMLKMKFRESCRGVFRSKNILTVPGLYIYKTLLFLHKNRHYFSPFVNSNNTRQICPYFYPKHRLSLTSKSPLYMGIKFLNFLPHCIRGMVEFCAFKREVYKLILKIEPYTIEEFRIGCL